MRPRSSSRSSSSCSFLYLPHRPLVFGSCCRCWILPHLFSPSSFFFLSLLFFFSGPDLHCLASANKLSRGPPCPDTIVIIIVSTCAKLTPSVVLCVMVFQLFVQACFVPVLQDGTSCDQLLLNLLLFREIVVILYINNFIITLQLSYLIFSQKQIFIPEFFCASSFQRKINSLMAFRKIF